MHLFYRDGAVHERHRPRQIETVVHHQHLAGEGFDRVFAAVGDFDLGALAGVVGLGLGAQETVEVLRRLGLGGVELRAQGIDTAGVG